MIYTPEEIPETPEIGDRILFKPFGWYDNPANYSLWAEEIPTVTGTVDYINREHRFVRVAYPMPGRIGHECFKF